MAQSSAARPHYDDPPNTSCLAFLPSYMVASMRMCAFMAGREEGGPQSAVRFEERNAYPEGARTRLARRCGPFHRCRAAATCGFVLLHHQATNRKAAACLYQNQQSRNVFGNIAPIDPSSPSLPKPWNSNLGLQLLHLHTDSGRTSPQSILHLL